MDGQTDRVVQIPLLIVDHALHDPELRREQHVAFSAWPARLGGREDRSQGFKFLLLNHVCPNCFYTAAISRSRFPYLIAPPLGAPP